MSISEPYDDRLMGELAALADGSLDGPRRAELEARVAGDPGLAAALAEQQRAVTLIRGAAAQLEAPLALRERIERDRERAAVRTRTPARRRRWLPSLAFAGVTAVVLAVVIALSGGPTVEDAAAFAAQPPNGPAPPAQGTLLRLRQSGVAFPAWAAKFGWKATGTRVGEVDGRPATTVYYEKGAKTLAYTIVSGERAEGARLLADDQCRGHAGRGLRRGRAAGGDVAAPRPHVRADRAGRARREARRARRLEGQGHRRLLRRAPSAPDDRHGRSGTPRAPPRPSDHTGSATAFSALTIPWP